MGTRAQHRCDGIIGCLSMILGFVAYVNQIKYYAYPFILKRFEIRSYIKLRNFHINNEYEYDSILSHGTQLPQSLQILISLNRVNRSVTDCRFPFLVITALLPAAEASGEIGHRQTRRIVVSRRVKV